MDIIVLIKQVPDMERVKFDSSRGVIDRSSAGTEINPFDLHALEEGVKIRERTGGKLTVVTMGPPSSEEALREALARGADEALLLSDKMFGGADTKATSTTLAVAIRKIGKFDVVIAGEKTVDGDTGQVGAETAEYLDIPHISYVDRVTDIGEDSLTVVSKLWGTSYVKKVKLPALITVTKDINVPRLPSFKNKMAAKKAVIPIITFDSLKDTVDESMVGLKGSPTKVKRIEIPPVITREGRICRENVPSFVDDIIEALRKKKIMEE